MPVKVGASYVTEAAYEFAKEGRKRRRQGGEGEGGSQGTAGKISRPQHHRGYGAFLWHRYKQSVHLAQDPQADGAGPGEAHGV